MAPKTQPIFTKLPPTIALITAMAGKKSEGLPRERY